MKNILIISAMPEEAQPLSDVLFQKGRHIRKGEPVEITWQGKRICILVTGVGKRNVLKNIEAVLNDGQAFDCAIIIGICGGITHTAGVGQMFIPNEVIHDDAKSIAIMWEDLIGAQDEKANGMHIGGTLLTKDAFIGQKEKRLLRNTYPAVCAVDMESYYVVTMLQEKKIPVCIIKTLSDTLKCLLPDEAYLIQYFRVKGWKKKIYNFFSSPFEAMKLMVFRFNIQKAIKINGSFVMSLLKRMK